MRRSVDQYDTEGRLVAGYDYINQAWVRGGVYVDCGHPAAFETLADGSVFEGCSCYGRLHRGEKPPIGNRSAAGDQDKFLLREWMLYAEGFLSETETRRLVAWTRKAVYA